ncbi:MAG: MBOAT family protein [Hespellia sp.]|nr:MBOAT family protein [Hespellia sp.]
MSLISLKFLIFVVIAVVGYYLIPKKYQWIWLLVFSYIYYISSGVKIVFFLVFSTAVTYMTGLLLQKSEEKESTLGKKKIKARKRKIITLALLLDFGMLGILKYTNFLLGSIGSVLGSSVPEFDFLLPLGISFYTFQSAGYVLDVYWGKCKPERNVFKFALFVSFFPQLMQGPIGRFETLAVQLYARHSFDGQRIERGVRRILWGYFKKLVIADNAAMFVNSIFGNVDQYSGLAIIGVLAYSAQLYGDFSGGIDVVSGIACLFGIDLDENFRRPYFATSITDFWHRWHITLGTWMKDYIFYPISLSKWMSRFGKKARKKLGKQIGRALPICIANIIVFLVVGIWHGAAWKFIVYGLYNGLVIGISGMLAPQFRQWKNALHINDKGKGWMVFQILRTFVLVNISWFFDMASNVPDALKMMRYAVTKFEISELFTAGIIPLGNNNPKYIMLVIATILFGCAVLFVVSVFQERGLTEAELYRKVPFALRCLCYVAILFILPVLGAVPVTSGGFIYAQF